MCQPKSRGGQRCAAHTRAEMQTAEARYASEPTADNHDALQAARAEYAATPTGREDLEQQLNADMYGDDAVDLAAALRRGEAIRERNSAVRDAVGEQAAARELAARLTNMSPNEVDTELAQKWQERYRLEDQIQSTKRSLDYTEARLRRQRRDPLPYEQKELDDSRERITTAEAKLAKHIRAMAPYGEEFRRRGGWNRYYLVVGNSSAGHLHESMNCSSTYPTTRYAWNPDLSGASQDKAIEEFGETCCTVCMPDAPANPNFHAPGSRNRAAQDERARERDERAAAKAAKAITHKDGGKLRGGFGDEIKTLRTAQITLVADSAYVAHLEKERDHPTHVATTVEAHRTHYQNIIDKYQRGVYDIEEAIASKTGQTVDEVRAEAAPKIAKKVRAGVW